MHQPDKHISDFELFAPNLIPATPIEYAYVFKGSNRLIQKATKDDLIAAVSENWQDVAYIKQGKDEPFEAFSKVSIDNTLIVEREIEALRKNRFYPSLYILGWSCFTFFSYTNYSTVSTLVVILVALIPLGLVAMNIIVYKRKMAKLKKQLEEIQQENQTTH